MLKKLFFIVVMMLIAFGCANQQKETAEIVVEEISLSVTGLR